VNTAPHINTNPENRPAHQYQPRTHRPAHHT